MPLRTRLGLALAGLAWAAVGAGAFHLTPPTTTWAVAGRSFDLTCKASAPLTSCAWTTPYGKKYPLGPGLTAEGGRLRHRGGDATECGLAVAAAETRDLGPWTCLVSVVNGSEATPAEGHAKVLEAHAPDAVGLFGPFAEGGAVANLSRSDAVDIDCVVNGARPEPEVAWFLGDARLEGRAVGDARGDVYVSRLAYVPEPDHDAKNLTCVVRHVGLDAPREAGVRLAFRDPVSVAESASDAGFSYYVAALLGLAASLVCGSLLVAFLKGWLRVRSSQGASDGADAPTKSAPEASPDGESEPEGPRPSWAERFARRLGRRADAGAESPAGADDAGARTAFSEKLCALLKKGGPRRVADGSDAEAAAPRASGEANAAVEEKQADVAAAAEEKSVPGPIASASPVHTSV